mgnify:CR=1 FL=1
MNQGVVTARMSMGRGVVHWFKFASPASFYPLAGKLIPWFWTLAALTAPCGRRPVSLPAPEPRQ